MNPNQSLPQTSYRRVSDELLAQPPKSPSLDEVDLPLYQTISDTLLGNTKTPAPEPTVDASQLETSSTPVSVPTPIEPTVPDVAPVQAVAEENDRIITADTEEAKRLAEVRQQYADVLDEEDLQTMFQSELGDRMVPEDMRRLKDVQLQLARLSTESLGRRVDIAREGGRTMRGAGLAVSAEQARNNVQSYGLAAEASILQGNIETATALASQAVGYAYQDRALLNQNLINQINSLQGVVDQQTAQLLQKEARRYAEDQQQIAQAVSSVNAAVASGFASADDVSTMTALSGDPQAQKEFADKIIARAARSQTQQALAATNAAADAATAQTGNAAAGKAVQAQAALNAIKEIKNNPLGIKAIAGGTGLGRTALSAGFDQAKAGFVGGTALGAGAGLIGGPLAPVTVTGGGAAGGVAGFIGGLGLGTARAAGQRTNVASALGYLVNSATFQEMRRLREQGVTFGSLTESERKAIGAAADQLFSALEVADDGSVINVKVTEDKFNQLLNEYEARQTIYLNEANRQAGNITLEDQAVIDGL